MFKGFMSHPFYKTLPKPFKPHKVFWDSKAKGTYIKKKEGK